MLKQLIAGVVVIACAAAPMSVSAFGLPKVPGVPGAGGGGAGAADVDTFLAQGMLATELFVKAQTALALALASKEQRSQIKAEYSAMTQISNPQDKNAAAVALLKSSDALLAEKLSSATTEAELTSLSAEQKAEAAKSVAMLGLAVLMQKQQVETGTKLSASISSNPMQLAKVGAIKDSIGSMASNVKMGATYIAKFPALFKSIGVSVVLPTDASTKAEEINMDAF